PGIALGWPWLYAFLFALFVIVAYATSRSVRRVERPLMTPGKLDAYVLRYRVISLGITLSSLAAFLLIAYNSGSIDLDRRTNLATVRQNDRVSAGGNWNRSTVGGRSGDARSNTQCAAHPAGHQ